MTAPMPPRSRRPVPMLFVIILTLVVTGFAAAVAIWMYWLAAIV